MPIGTYLSGGIDSSFVTIMASKILDKQIKSLVALLKKGRNLMNFNTHKLRPNRANAELFEIFPTEQEFIDLIPKLIYHLDEPVAGPGFFLNILFQNWLPNM